MSRRAVAASEALASGWDASARHFRVALWCWAATVAVSLPAAAAVGLSVHGYAGASASVGDFARHLDPLLAIGFVKAHGRTLAPALLGLLAAALILWTAGSAFVSGATIDAVGRVGPVATRDLFESGGRVFWRLVRLLCFSLPFTLIAGGLPAAVAWKAAEKLTEAMTSERHVLAIKVCAIGVGLLAVGFANAVCDLMKVHAVAGDEARARRAFWYGLISGLRRPLGLLAIYLPFTGTALALTVLVSLVDVRLSRTSWGTIALGIAIQQGTVLARAVIKIGLAGAEVRYAGH